MTCLRCSGLMHEEAIIRRHGPRLLLWSCFACGERIDGTIWFNRQCQRIEREMNEADDPIWAEIQRQVALLGALA